MKIALGITALIFVLMMVVVQSSSPSSSVNWRKDDSMFSGIYLSYCSAPTFADLDNDGDLDLIVGQYGGHLAYYENVSTGSSPAWVRDYDLFKSVSVNWYSVPIFGDLDNDGDLDLTMGKYDVMPEYYENTGTVSNPNWKFRYYWYAGVYVGYHGGPTFADLDGDGDLDLTIGHHMRFGFGFIGNLRYFENTGTCYSPVWTRDDLMFSGIDSFSAEDSPKPTFSDLDNDGDFDLVIGVSDGTLQYYENTGTVSSPIWTRDDSMFSGIDVGWHSAPTFADLDNDGDQDLIVGQYYSGYGSLKYYERISLFITSPTAGDVVSNTVNIIASVTYDTETTAVDFFCDSVLLTSDTASPYSVSWDTTQVSDGEHEIQAKAHHTSGSTEECQITVVVKNVDLAGAIYYPRMARVYNSDEEEAETQLFVNIFFYQDGLCESAPLYIKTYFESTQGITYTSARIEPIRRSEEGTRFPDWPSLTVDSDAMGYAGNIPVPEAAISGRSFVGKVKFEVLGKQPEDTTYFTYLTDGWAELKAEWTDFVLRVDSYSFTNFLYSHDQGISSSLDRVVATISPSFPLLFSAMMTLEWYTLMQLFPSMPSLAHCFGMAASSLYYKHFPGDVPSPLEDKNDNDEDDVYDLSLDIDKCLETIQDYQLTQLFYPAAPQNAAQVYTEIKEATQANSPQVVALFSNEPKPKKEHGVTHLGFSEYKTQKIIAAYDNNFPEMVLYLQTDSLEPDYHPKCIVPWQGWLSEFALKHFAQRTLQEISEHDLRAAAFHSPVETLFVDNEGRRIGRSQGIDYAEIDNALYAVIDNTEVFLIPEDLSGHFTSQGDASGSLGAEFVFSTEEATVRWESFANLPVTEHASFKFSLGASSTYVVDIDQSGDGSYEERKYPDKESFIPIDETFDPDCPDITLTAPVGGQIYSSAVNISWLAADPNEDPLTVNVYYSSDAGANWHLLAPNEDNDGTYEWDTESFDDGNSYKIEVVASDGVNNDQDQSRISFGIDNTPPEIIITSPSSGDTISRIVNITASASDASGITRVEFFCDDAFIASDTTNTYSCSFDTVALISDGTCTLKAIAYDTQGLSATDSILVVVDNTDPESNISSPASGDTISGTIDIVGTAWDANFKEYILEYGEGTSPSSWVSITTSTTPVSYAILATWDTASVSDGAYTFKLTVEDEAGNTKEDKVLITIDNTLPQVTITSPESGDVVSGTLDASASATDDTGIAQVEFWCNSTFIASDTSNDYSVSFDTVALISDGTCTLKAIAYDTQGLSATDSILVVVDNTDPEANITSPASGETISGTIDIVGTAWDANFKEYILEYGEGTSPSSWVSITTSTTPVSYTSLATWDTASVSDGAYTFKLTVEDEANNISWDTVTVNINNIPPVIVHTPTPSATNHQDLLITAAVSSECALSSVTIYYRKAGKDSYSSASMTPGFDYQGTIPASVVTERGLEYYLEARDINGNIATVPDVNPDTSPWCVRINFSSLTFPFSTLQKKWQMISVPADLDSPDPNSVLVDDLGTQDNTKWKLYRWNTANNSYDEYPNIPDNFTSGKAFWLITKDSKNIDVGKGGSVDTSSDYAVNSPSGWAQLGNPFAFDVDWDDVKVRKGLEIVSIQQAQKNGWVRDKIWYWNGSEYEFSQAPSGTLESWKGYWVKVLVSGCEFLIPPVAVEADGSSKALAMGRNNYLQIIAKIGDLKDSYNFIGLSNKAKDSYDSEDVEEAPPISPYISLSFPHSDWGKDNACYTQDIRKTQDKEKSQPEKIIWDMQIKTDQTDKTITLEWKNAKAIPEEYFLYLTDEDESTLANMREKNAYSFTSSTGKDNFKVIATTKELSSLPEDLTLTEVYNYPNPADDTTNIHFKLGAEANVTIRIYTISGELVWMKGQSYDTQGVYEILWNLKNDQGQKVASGVYILYVKASNSAKTVTKTNKIAIIR